MIVTYHLLSEKFYGCRLEEGSVCVGSRIAESNALGEDGFEIVGSVRRENECFGFLACR